MPISKLTLQMIKGHPVKVAATGLAAGWCGWIMTDTEQPRALLCTSPLYVSHEAALQAMNDLVWVIRGGQS